MYEGTQKVIFIENIPQKSHNNSGSLVQSSKVLNLVLNFRCPAGELHMPSACCLVYLQASCKTASIRITHHMGSTASYTWNAEQT